jgi:GAF domain-containing protein
MVVCVEPDADRLAHTRETLESAGDLTTVGVRTVEETLDLVTAETVDCVVTALDLPDGDGLDLMRQVREKTPETGCILYSERSVRDIETATAGTVVAEYIFRDLPDAERRLRDLVRNVAANRTQIGYPVSDDESDRLAALDRYDVDYLATLETFDRMTRLARAHFDVSVAFVGLIEDREERFIACHGADWERLAREDSICTWAMLENDVTVIEDVQTDDRFAANHALRDMDIRAYAGTNLEDGEGNVLGTLCLTNDEPRRFDETDRLHLRLFAEEVSEQLELRRQLAAVEGVGD